MALSLDDLRGRRVLIAGWGVSGRALLEPLRELGARIGVTDGRPAALAEAAATGLDTIDDAGFAGPAGAEYALVVVSPGVAPHAPLVRAAAGHGIPVWGDIEFSWRWDRSGRSGPARQWLVVTGTNGKTTTTSMLASIVDAAGLAGVACGNIGLPVMDALRLPDRRDVLAVELSSFQLYWAPSVRPAAGVVLNIAEDHLDWHGGMAGYVAAKARALTGDVAVVGLDDPIAASLLADAPAPRRVGFRLGEPAPGELGVAGGCLVDRAFGVDADDDVILAPAAEISPPGPAGLLDALAAAALARAIGVSADAVGRGLAAHRVGPHRAALVRELAGVGFIDDSKATNPHAARSSMLAHPRVVWVAGGLLKGASVAELVAETADRLAAAVLIGTDAGLIADALARHAPDVPVVVLSPGDDAGVTAVPRETVELGESKEGGEADAVMRAAVRAAAGLARPGDVVLLAPAAASLDMFRSYGHRGDSFAAAVHALAAAEIGARP